MRVLRDSAHNPDSGRVAYAVAQKWHVTTIRFPPELWERAKQEAQRQTEKLGVPVDTAVIVRRALQDYLDRVSAENDENPDA